jgi:chaperonin GroES
MTAPQAARNPAAVLLRRLRRLLGSQQNGALRRPAGAWPRACRSGVPPFLFSLATGALSMAIRPLQDRILVKRSDPELKTASGIVIPDSAGEKPEQGEVLAVGPGKRNDKGDFVTSAVKVGDRVLFGKYAGQTVKVDGDEVLVVREDDVLAVIDR